MWGGPSSKSSESWGSDRGLLNNTFVTCHMRENQPKNDCQTLVDFSQMLRPESCIQAPPFPKKQKSPESHTCFRWSMTWGKPSLLDFLITFLIWSLDTYASWHGTLFQKLTFCFLFFLHWYQFYSPSDRNRISGKSQRFNLR